MDVVHGVLGGSCVVPRSMVRDHHGAYSLWDAPSMDRACGYALWCVISMVCDHHGMYSLWIVISMDRDLQGS
jgi:uncharacterized protein YbdZ (MbtH family)